MRYFCCDDRRRDAVAAHPTLNGIDFLEVVDDPADPIPDRQRTLLVHFVKNLRPGALAPENVRVEGGERIRGIGVLAVTSAAPTSPPSSPPSPPQSPPASPPLLAGNVLVVEVDQAGD